MIHILCDYILSTNISKLDKVIGYFYIYVSLFYLFIYFWLCWVCVAMRGLSLVAVSGGYSSLQCMCFSLR